MYDKTNCDWAPTINLGHDKLKPLHGATSLARYERTVGRAAKRSRLDTANRLLSMQTSLVEDQAHDVIPPVTDDVSKECQTDMSGDALHGMEEEMRRLTLENSTLETELASAKLTECSLAGNDDEVNFLSGLPTHYIFMQLYNFVSPRLHETHRSSPSKFQQLLMTLMNSA